MRNKTSKSGVKSVYWKDNLNISVLVMVTQGFTTSYTQSIYSYTHSHIGIYVCMKI